MQLTKEESSKNNPRKSYLLLLSIIKVKDQKGLHLIDFWVLRQKHELIANVPLNNMIRNRNDIFPTKVKRKNYES